MEKELQDSVAEIFNTRQRMIRDKNEALKYDGVSLASKIIPIINGVTKG